MSTLLPELTDYAGYKKALAQEKKALQAVETTQAQAQELQQQAQVADAAGAAFKDLQTAQGQAAEARRAAELAARELDRAAVEVQELLLEAEAQIKEAAKEAGKKIVNKITRALTALETGQKEHKALIQEVKQKVDFPRPLSGENAERYTGPDPAPVFAAKSWPVIGYKESCARYLKDWPEPEKLKSNEYEPKGQIMLG
ncbi:MAG: hypothetical protein SCJ94_06795 [Bacillota bacterium]|nr:hypothetical protein [Bacillota bacterium]